MLLLCGVDARPHGRDVPEPVVLCGVDTHCFHPFETCIMQCDVDTHTKGSVEPVVVEAQQRGVLMDVGHGSGSFSWPVVERCIADGFYPDCISTDIWTLTSHGPCYDLPTGRYM